VALGFIHDGKFASPASIRCSRDDAGVDAAANADDDDADDANAVTLETKDCSAGEASTLKESPRPGKI